MRQLLVQVPRGCGADVLDIAKKFNGTNLAQLEATASEKALDVVFVHVSNSKVEGLLGALEELPDLHVTLVPHGVIALQPPPSQAPEQATNVEELSPIEVFLGGLQSIGSWIGLLGYAATAGVVVWIGLFTNTIFLLTAAMLIAPFAGPAMNAAIATARGDRTLLGRSLLRYFASLAVTIAVTWILSMVMRQEVATDLMVAQSNVSTVAVLLPLVAGAAGALNLVQSERSSLVSGAATGMLIAASLAPPTGLVGMASAIGEWEMVVNAVFLLLLQLVGINLAGAIIFRIYDLSARGARYHHGKPWMFPAVLAATVIALAGLLTWQFVTAPNLQRPTIAQRAAAEIQQVVNKSDLAELVDANVRFTRANIEGQNTLLGVVYVQPREGVAAPPQEIRNQLRRAIQERLQDLNVTPLIDVNVLEAPDSRQTSKLN